MSKRRKEGEGSGRAYLTSVDQITVGKFVEAAHLLIGEFFPKYEQLS